MIILEFLSSGELAYLREINKRFYEVVKSVLHTRLYRVLRRIEKKREVLRHILPRRMSDQRRHPLHKTSNIVEYVFRCLDSLLGLYEKHLQVCELIVSGFCQLCKIFRPYLVYISGRILFLFRRGP